MKFLHAADLHIDSPLRGLDRNEGAPVGEIRGATRRAFSALIDLALAERVDFVVLAGDIFDGSWPDVGTGLFFFRELDRLVSEQNTIPVFIALGNHDAVSRLTSRMKWPKHIVRFSHDAPQSEVLEECNVVLHGQSFAMEAVTIDLAASYPAAHPNRHNIGVLHTALGGHAAHARYAPTTLDILRSKGYDAWCLGHVHERAVIGRDPLILYPGNIQGRHVNECGPRGCYIIEKVDGGLRETFYPLDVVRWYVLPIDCADLESWDAALARIAHEFNTLSEISDERLICVRIEFSGNTKLNDEFRQSLADLRADAIRLAGERNIWVESVRIKTRPPISRHTLAQRADLMADLLQSLESAHIEGPRRIRIQNALSDVQLKIPIEVIEAYGTRVDEGTGLDEAIDDAAAILAAYVQR